MTRANLEDLYSLIVSETATAIRSLVGYADSTPRRSLFSRTSSARTATVKDVIYGLAHNLHNAGGHYSHETAAQGNVRLWLRDLPAEYGRIEDWDLVLEHAQYLAQRAGWTLQDLWDECSDRAERPRDYAHVAATPLYPLPDTLNVASR